MRYKSARLDDTLYSVVDIPWIYPILIHTFKDIRLCTIRWRSCSGSSAGRIDDDHALNSRDLRVWNFEKFRVSGRVRVQKKYFHRVRVRAGSTVPFSSDPVLLLSEIGA